uniref:Uncharacterized protein n=1 Tax=Setaria italica TaxID=4555 RepID=K3Z201_SETIT
MEAAPCGGAHTRCLQSSCAAGAAAATSCSTQLPLPEAAIQMETPLFICLVFLSNTSTQAKSKHDPTY